MKFSALDLSGLVLITPKVFADERGHFFEWWNTPLLKQNGIDATFVQANHSRSKKGVLRGLHFQRPPRAQDKLVRVVRGKALDVMLDIRTGSPTFGRWTSVELSEKNNHAIFIPKGFAHGFLAQSDVVEFEYLVSDTWVPEAEGGVRWDDPDLAISWGIADPIMHAKDKAFPRLQELGSVFTYEG